MISPKSILPLIKLSRVEQEMSNLPTAITNHDNQQLWRSQSPSKWHLWFLWFLFHVTKISAKISNDINSTIVILIVIKMFAVNENRICYSRCASSCRWLRVATPRWFSQSNYQHFYLLRSFLLWNLFRKILVLCSCEAEGTVALNFHLVCKGGLAVR